MWYDIYDQNLAFYLFFFIKTIVPFDHDIKIGLVGVFVNMTLGLVVASQV